MQGCVAHGGAPRIVRWAVDSESCLGTEIAGDETAVDRTGGSNNRNGLGGGIDGEGFAASIGEVCACAEPALKINATSDAANVANPRPPMPWLRDRECILQALLARAEGDHHAERDDYYKAILARAEGDHHAERDDYYKAILARAEGDHHAERDDYYKAILARADAPPRRAASAVRPFIFSSKSSEELRRKLDEFFFTIPIKFVGHDFSKRRWQVPSSAGSRRGW